ncbi:hypothetical protein B9Z19DRAFT_1021720 [Tuber borchii]|uniref:SAP domain-containing protein n=1 Tax=Tuber borchii TaxID=42251 RepID=A0A2T6ZXN4_TUBBO|nr:hypothetical protein B9Z19DRAFT_1021720 [Tuber borchii]
MPSVSDNTSVSDLKIDRLRVGELRALCLEKDLPDDGKKAALVKRLKTCLNKEKAREQARRANLPPTPKCLGPGKCTAVLKGSADIGNDDDMIDSARKSLKAALYHDELLVDRDIPQLAVENRGGLELAAFPDRVHVLESTVATLVKKISILDGTVASLQGQVDDLTVNSKSYLFVRHRFLVFYKRQNQTLDDFDRGCIDKGNGIAHAGDARADAQLYRGPECRKDFNIYKQLYGFHPDIVLRIDHSPTLALLNLHATIKSDTRRVASEKFYALFAVFIARFEASNFDPTYLDCADENLVTLAYSEFCGCIKDEVKKAVAKPAAPNPS